MKNKTSLQLYNNNKNNNNNNSDSRYTWIKQFYTTFDLFINDLLQNGVQFYTFTIMFPDNKTKADTLNIIDEVNNQNDNANLYEYGLQSSLTGDFIERGSPLSPDDYKNYIKNGSIQFLDFLNNIELIEFSYMSVEYTKPNKEGYIMPHYHCLIGVRSIIGRNPVLGLQINKMLFEWYKDIQFREVKNMHDIRTAFNYVVKEHNFKDHYIGFYKSEQLNFITSKMFDDMDCLSYLIRNFEDGIITDESRDFNSLVNIKVFPKNKYKSINHNGMLNDSTQKNIVIYLFNLYFKLNDIVIFNNNMHIKDKYSKFTWGFHKNLEYLKDNYLEIISFLKFKFPMQLENVDLQSIIYNELNNAFKLIEQVPNLLLHDKIHYNIIEFTDGLYFIDMDYFLCFYKDNIKSILKDNPVGLKVYKRYNTSFRKLSKPELWFSMLSKNESLNTQDKIEEFSTHIGRYIQSTLIEDKKNRSLFIKGESNTGKTELVANILIEAKGKENIGNINNSTTFAFENTMNKTLIMSDEFEYKLENRSNIIKMLTNELLSINRKYKSHTQLFKNQAPVIFISNKIDSTNLMLSDAAFINRMIVYELNHIINSIAEADINKSRDTLKKEIPSIIVYCNKLFYKSVKSNKNKRLIIKEIYKLLN